MVLGRAFYQKTPGLATAACRCRCSRPPQFIKIDIGNIELLQVCVCVCVCAVYINKSGVENVSHAAFPLPPPPPSAATALSLALNSSMAIPKNTQ